MPNVTVEWRKPTAIEDETVRREKSRFRQPDFPPVPTEATREKPPPPTVVDGRLFTGQLARWCGCGGHSSPCCETELLVSCNGPLSDGLPTHVRSGFSWKSVSSALAPLARLRTRRSQVRVLQGAPTRPGASPPRTPLTLSRSRLRHARSVRVAHSLPLVRSHLASHAKVGTRRRGGDRVAIMTR